MSRLELPPELPAATAPTGGNFVWEERAADFPRHGPPGLSYWCGRVKAGDVVATSTTTGERQVFGRIVHTECDCLVYRSRKGELIGILQYYAHESPAADPGTVDLVVHPRRRRRGIGRALLAEADRRWSIDWWKQLYTPEGRALVAAYVASSQRKMGPQEKPAATP